MASLSDILDDDLLFKLAGETYFERGVSCFEQGRVQSLAQYDDRITAEVIGTEVYQVHLWLEDYDLQSRCTCLLGADGIFCKHCVAVGLAWISEPPHYRPIEEALDRSFKTPRATMQDVRDYLMRQDRNTLVQMILDRAMDDLTWRESLLVKAAVQPQGRADINSFRRAMRQAIAVGDFVDYYATAGYAAEIETLLEGLEDLLDNGYALDVMELCEEATELLEEALGAVDDSNGEMHEIIERVQDLHYQACKQAQPNPSALAKRLFQMELDSSYGFFDNAVVTYADILGDDGLDTYQNLVDEQWDQLPPLTPSSERSFDFRRLTLSRMKEHLVSLSGDMDEWIDVMSKDLSS